jgi:hypothetical protein
MASEGLKAHGKSVMRAVLKGSLLQLELGSGEAVRLQMLGVSGSQSGLVAPPRKPIFSPMALNALLAELTSKSCGIHNRKNPTRPKIAHNMGCFSIAAANL